MEITNSHRDAIHEYCFHGILRLKQNVEHFLIMDKLFRPASLEYECNETSGYWDFQSIFLKNICLEIYKIAFDNSSRLLKEIRPLIESSEKLSGLYEDFKKELPDQKVLEKLRHNRLAHLAYTRVAKSGSVCYVEEQKAYIEIIHKISDGRLIFCEKLEELGEALIQEYGCDSEAYQGDLNALEERAKAFWGWAISHSDYTFS